MRRDNRDAGPSSAETDEKRAGFWDFGNEAKSGKLYAKGYVGHPSNIKVCAWDGIQGDVFLWSKQGSSNPVTGEDLRMDFEIDSADDEKTTSIGIGFTDEPGWFATCAEIKEAAGW